MISFLVSLCLLGVASANQNYFLTYPSYEDCRTRTDTVTKIVTKSTTLPATASECQQYASLCSQQDNTCTVEPACLYEAVPSIKSEFVIFKEYNGENCTQTPDIVTYYRIGKCIRSSGKFIKVHCDGKTIMKEYNTSDCSKENLIENVHMEKNKCYHDDTAVSAECPSELPETKPQRKNRTSDATIAVAVVASLIVVALIGAVIYYQRK